MRTSGSPPPSAPLATGVTAAHSPARAPRTLCGFEPADADFFLTLLPGPRDSDGMPLAVRFWKSRLEERDPERTFRVGLIYGPAGCGKSLLVQVGLLPKLAGGLTAVYLEADTGDVEARLLRAVRQQAPDLPEGMTLVEALAAVRQGRGLPPGRKLVLILDQLEGWLQATAAQRERELVRALRQCDGRRVQAFLVVRDDRWLSAMRLFRELEVPLLEGHNAAPVDRFDAAHARQVLVTLGRSVGALPQGALEPEQERFLDQSLAALSEDGKVVPLRLGRFAETVRGRPWRPETLRETGRAERRAARDSGAERRLAEHAARWSAEPHKRNLPSARDWLRIRLRSRRLPWTSNERRMMRAAARHYLLRGLAALALLVLLGAAGLYLKDRLEEKRRAAHAHELVSQLLVADIGQVPALIGALEGYRAWSDPELSRIADDPGRSPRHRLRASLALDPNDERRLAYLLERLLGAGPDDVRVIRMRLLGCGDRLVEPLWDVMASAKTQPAAKLRAASALAVYAPEDQRWREAAGPVVGQLVREHPWLLPQWVALLRPARKHLLAELARVYRGQGGNPVERAAATGILADYAGDDPEMLYDLVTDAEPWQYNQLIDKVSAYRAELGARLLGELLRRPPPGADKEARDRLARRQANAAVTLFRMRRYEPVWRLLRQSPDPRVRSFLVHSLSAFGADPLPLVQRWYDEPDVSARRALLLSLGEFDPARLPTETRTRLRDDLLSAYREHPDPGLRGAAAWLLRRWGAGDRLTPLDAARQSREPVPGRSWYVNGQGHTMVLVNERGGPAERGPCFAIAAWETSLAQFRRFRPAAVSRQPNEAAGDYPVHGVSWLDAAAYCRWLSEREGIPEDQMCYPPVAQIRGGLTLPRDYRKRTGYRLPTEAEWETACQAGARTSRFYGEADELLPKYAWYEGNSQRRPQPLGRLKPNDLGLFDVLGNAMEWCQDADGPEVEQVRGDVLRVARGGSFNRPAEGVHGSQRDFASASTRWPSLGFRVARTIRGSQTRPAPGRGGI